MVHEIAGTPAVIHVTVVGSERGLRPGIRRHRVQSLDADEISKVEGLPVTSPGRTLVDLAPSITRQRLEMVAGTFERKGVLDPGQAEDLLERYRGYPGISRLRSVLGLEGGPAFIRSRAESRLLELVREAQLPPPSVNHKLGPWEVDFFWEQQGVVVEVDGWDFHGSRDRFHRDRRKDRWLRARGITVLRVTWAELTDRSMATMIEIGATLAQAGPRGWAESGS